MKIERAKTLCMLLAVLLAWSGPVLAGGGKTGNGNSSGKPAAPAAYIAPMSHLDLTFMGTVEECLSRGGKVLAGALNILDTKADTHLSSSAWTTCSKPMRKTF